MNRLKTMCLALTALGFAGGVAVAQPTASDPAAQPSKSDPNNTGATTSGTMGNSNDMSASPNSTSAKMSPSDMKTMKSCQAMSHDAMMADAKCKAFGAAHPDMMNGASPPPN